MPDLPPPSRRQALSLLAALPMAGFASQSQPERAALLVAGPPQGRLDRWADLLLPALGRVLPGVARQGAEPVTRSAVGGADGVTGANQFEARVAPDGDTALLLPGAAATAWLVGDPRARFDAAGWVPAWAGLASAVLVSRAPLAPGRPLRIGGVRPAGSTLPALLALDLLGIAVTPCDDRTADAVFLGGQGARAAVALQRGMTPVLTLGALDPAGSWGRDPAFPAVPTAVEAVSRPGSRRDPPPALLAALRAASAAALLDAALVLPQLSPANRVALWRRACAQASGTAVLANEAATLGVRPVPAPAAAALMAAVAADMPTLLALRGWLDARWGLPRG